jgi:hypothetical protein
LACNVVTAAQTTKAEDDERPAAGGTRLSIRIFIPVGFAIFPLSGELKARIAL